MTDPKRLRILRTMWSSTGTGPASSAEDLLINDPTLLDSVDRSAEDKEKFIGDAFGEERADKVFDREIKMESNDVCFTKLMLDMGMDFTPFDNLSIFENVTSTNNIVKSHLCSDFESLKSNSSDVASQMDCSHASCIKKHINKSELSESTFYTKVKSPKLFNKPLLNSINMSKSVFQPTQSSNVVTIIKTNNEPNGILNQKQVRFLSKNDALPLNHGNTKKIHLTREEMSVFEEEGILLPAFYPQTKQEEIHFKMIKRKIQNKISARNSRKRNKLYVIDLEDKLKQYYNENKQLKNTIHSLQTENDDLKKALKSPKNFTQFQSRVNL